MEKQIVIWCIYTNQKENLTFVSIYLNLCLPLAKTTQHHLGIWSFGIFWYFYTFYLANGI